MIRVMVLVGVLLVSAASRAESASAEALRSAVNTFSLDGDKAAFRAKLLGLVKADPTLVAARLNLGIIDASEGRYDDAIRSFGECERLARGKEEGKRAAVERAMAESLKAEIGTPEAVAARYSSMVEEARLLVAVGQPAEGLAKATTASTLLPSRFEAFQVLAAAQVVLGRLKEAEASLSAALKTAPAAERTRLQASVVDIRREREVVAACSAARVALDARKPADALRAYEKALKLAPGRGDVALRAAYAASAANDSARAKALLETARKSPDDTVAAAATAELARLTTAEARLKRLDDALAKVDAVRDQILAAPEEADRVLGLHASGAPPALRQALRKALLERRVIRDVAIAPNGGWVVLGDSHWFASEGIPAGMKTALEAGAKAKEELHGAAFGTDGRWIFLRGANGWVADGLEPELNAALVKANAAGEVLTGVALGDKGRWLALRGENGAMRAGVPAAAEQSYQTHSGAGEALPRVVLGAKSWLIQRGGNGYSQDGMPAGLLATIDSIRSADGVVGAIGLAPRGGWVVIERR